MTQQPYYPPGPQQPYPGQPAVQYPPQYPAAPQNVGYPPPAQQPYAQQYAPQPPAAPPRTDGTLDDYYAQPSSGGGPGISWQDKAGNKKPIGTSYAGTVARDVTNGDVQQQTNPQGQPQTYRDGRPKFQMKVPLKNVVAGGNGQPWQASPEFPEGEAAWYVRGQGRDELTRAMAEAGCSGAPKAGATITVTLVQRRPSGAGFQPANIVQVTYLPAPGEAGGQPHQMPVQQPAPEAVTQPPPVQQAPVQQQPPLVVPTEGHYQQGPVQVPVQQPPPVQQTQASPVVQQPLAPPADLNPEQQLLLARLTGGQG